MCVIEELKYRYCWEVSLVGLLFLFIYLFWFLAYFFKYVSLVGLEHFNFKWYFLFLYKRIFHIVAMRNFHRTSYNLYLKTFSNTAKTHIQVQHPEIDRS